MNKEEAKKHGEVIKWWVDNPEKGVWFRDYIRANITQWEHTNSPTFNPILPHVQNDEYAELRMAQADGKVIQYKGSCDHKFRDCYKDACFSEKSEYRIKPDEPKFSVGDWIMSNIGDPVLAQKFHLTKTKPSCYKLWKPKEGEYVVILDDNYDLDTYTIQKYDSEIFGNCKHIIIYPLEFAMTLNDK